AWIGSNGSARPRHCAVFGMNCATPCAPFRLTARGLNLLSCQIRRVKNSIGSSFAAAADCTAEQIDSRLGGSPGARDWALASPSRCGAVSALSAGRSESGTAECTRLPGDAASGGIPGLCSSAPEAPEPMVSERAITQAVQPAERMAKL